MLGKQGIISQAESNDIVACLKQILKEVESGSLKSAQSMRISTASLRLHS